MRILLLLPVALFLLVGSQQAEAGIKDRAVANKTIAAHKSLSNQYEGYLQDNESAFIALSEQVGCAATEFSQAPISSLTENEKLILGFATFSLYSDSLRLLPSQGGNSLSAYQQRLQKRAMALLAKRKISPRGKVISRGLLGHKQLLRTFASAPPLNFCQVLIDWRESDYDKNTMLSAVTPYVAFLLDSNKFSSGLTRIDQSRDSMLLVRPIISKTRIEAFSEPVMYEAMQPMLQRSGDKREVLSSSCSLCLAYREFTN